ncbi:hypothetical protein C4J81_01890 [Deltaproteobacteria bacterium Smac51]|nr:hypothetical protein C4J81_01890 [Deltaproteobacteria bacterium Smac51]
MKTAETSQRIYDAVLNYPLVILTAPVGFGKTFVARRIAARINHRPPGTASSDSTPEKARAYYMSASHGESGLDYLWARHLSVPEAVKSPLSAILEKYPDPFSLQYRSMALDYLKRLADSHPMVIIIDDFHCLESARLSSFFSRIIKAGISGLSFLLISRSRPALPLEEMRIKNQCRVFGPDSLTLGFEAATEFFKARNIDDQEFIRRSWARNEGWPAALLLDAEEYGRSGHLCSDTDLFHLFEESVFPFHTAEERTFLLEISSLDKFTERQALNLCLSLDLNPLLLYSMADYSFIQFNKNTGMYRMHPVCRDYCQLKLYERSYSSPVSVRLPAPEAAGGPGPNIPEALMQETCPSLTLREKKMMEQVVAGKNNRQIAEQLSVQRITVAKALSGVYRKFGVSNRAQAISAFLHYINSL